MNVSVILEIISSETCSHLGQPHLNLFKKHLNFHFVQLKSDSYPPKKCYICFNESAFKMMKNDFGFILKALFFLKIFRFFVWTFWSCRKRWFD